MTNIEPKSLTGVITTILSWFARGFLVPFAGITTDSIKLIWFGISNNRPEILPPYTLTALLGFSMFILAIYVGFILSSNSVKEIRV